MPEKHLSRSAMLMALLVVVILGSWEIYLRHTGVAISYDDGKELWANKRAMVYEPSDKATVFIGSSRIKYDLDIDTWEKTTGRHAIQLAAQGSSPVPTLVDFGNDPRFKGKLVVDVTEPLFFTPQGSSDKDQRKYIAWYHSQTPAQWASFRLDHALESSFVFLDRDFFSLNAGLEQLKVANRPGVFVFPDFPYDFTPCLFSRQSKMTDRFVADTSLQHQGQNIWTLILQMGRSAPHDGPDPTPGIVQSVVTAVDQIRARGGDVVFIRTPSSAPFLEAKKHGFPRAKLWDPLLVVT